MPFGVDHHAGVEEAGVADAVGRHAGHRGQDHLAHQPRVQRRGHDRRGRVRAHAAGVGAAVAVLQPLVILRRGQREHVAAVDHDDEARLLAGEEFLDDHACAGVAHRVVDQHRIDRLVRLARRRRHDHALPGGEPVGLDDDRCAVALDVGVRGRGVGEGLVARSRDAVARHEGLREVLRALELRGRLRGAEDGEAGLAERVDDARGQRALRADHGERDVALARERDEVGDRRSAGHWRGGDRGPSPRCLAPRTPAPRAGSARASTPGRARVRHCRRRGRSWTGLQNW